MTKKVLKHRNEQLYVPVGGMPSFLDLDDDGDLDIVLYTSGFYFQENDCPTFVSILCNSIEETAGTDSLTYIIGNKCWGKITRDKATQLNRWISYDCDTSCNSKPFNREGSQFAHAIHDLNGDGLLDIITTYTHKDDLFALHNIGTNENSIIGLALNDSLFPIYDQRVELPNQPYPYFMDVDHDGDDDMVVGANQVSVVHTPDYDTSDAQICDVFYRNNGSNSNPKFELEKRGYFSGEMIDVGIRSFPAYGDLTGDGLPELIIGNTGYSVFNPDLSPAYISYYKNLGSENEPLYKLVNSNLAEVNALDLFIAHPTLGDLDNDGDLDMIVGDGNGYVHYYENRGTPSSIDFELNAEKYKGIRVSGEAHPQLFDLNKDGQLDLIIGDLDGKLHYFENDGTPSSPNFDQNATLTKLGSIDLGASRSGMASPYFTRNLDGTDQLYLFIGTNSGIVNVYGPIDKFLEPYTLGDSIVVEGTQTTITGLHLVGDPRDELCIGQRSGGLYLLSRDNNQGVGFSETPMNEPGNISVHPNPSSSSVNLSLKTTNSNRAQLTISDIKGNRLVSKQIIAQNGFFNEKIDVAQFSKGVYFIQISESERLCWTKIIVD